MIEQIKESIGFDLAIQQILSSIDGMIGLDIFIGFFFIYYINSDGISLGFNNHI